jgi:hypothetical protein
MDHQASTFPHEIWMEILRYCSQETLLILSRVSPLLWTEARKLLLRTVVSKYHTDFQNEHMGIIHRPRSFYEFLATNHIDWRWMIKSVKLCWISESIDKDGNNVLMGRDKPIQDHLIFKTALLLCECTRLREFHMSARSIMVVTKMLEFGPLPMTTLDFALPYRFSWLDVYAVFSMPTLVTLVIRNLLSPDPPSFRLPSLIPDELHDKIGTSNVQDLSLLSCGPLTQFIPPLFRWPKNLRKLKYAPMRSKCDPYWRTLLRRTGDISDAVDLSVQVLSPLIPTLQELHFDLGLDRHWTLPFQTGTLFQPFTSLKHLTAPIELIMHSRGLSRSRSSQPFYTNLPHRLETLELKFTISTTWHSRPVQTELDSEDCVGSDLAHQLYDELTTLAMHKGNWFSELRQLTLTGDEEERPFLVKCRHAEIALGDVEDSGINIVEGKWHRIACVRKAST